MLVGVLIVLLRHMMGELRNSKKSVKGIPFEISD